MQILIVEDSENDTLLLLEEFERRGYSPVFELDKIVANLRIISLPKSNACAIKNRTISRLAFAKGRVRLKKRRAGLFVAQKQG